MSRFRGTGNNRGAALGTSIILKPGEKEPELSQRILDHIVALSKWGRGEPYDAILMGPRLQDLQGISIPFVRFVGHAADTPSEFFTESLSPVVIADLGEVGQLPGDVLVLIDSDAGTIDIEPDVAAIALFQTHSERLAPPTRFSLESEHLPAKTIDGRLIQVIAEASEKKTAMEAARYGADSVLLRGETGLFSSLETDEAQFELIAAIARANEKPLLVSGDPYTVSIPSLMRAAAVAAITFLVPQGEGGIQLSQLSSYIGDVAHELREEDVSVGSVALGISMEIGSNDIDLMDVSQCSRIWIRMQSLNHVRADGNMDWLDELTQFAYERQIPVLMSLDDVNESTIAMAVGLGASGLIVKPEEAGRTKDFVRALSYQDCTGALAREQ